MNKLRIKRRLVHAVRSSQTRGSLFFHPMMLQVSSVMVFSRGPHLHFDALYLPKFGAHKTRQSGSYSGALAVTDWTVSAWRNSRSMWRTWVNQQKYWEATQNVQYETYIDVLVSEKGKSRPRKYRGIPVAAPVFWALVGRLGWSVCTVRLFAPFLLFFQILLKSASLRRTIAAMKKADSHLCLLATTEIPDE